MGRFRGVATQEGIQTSDKRTIGLNETSWRELPLTLMAMLQSSHGGGTNTTAPAGAFDVMERQPGEAEGTFNIYFEGYFDEGAVGVEVERLVGAKVLRGVSIDFAADEDTEILDVDEDGWPIDWLTTYTNVEIGAATVCPFPAFAGGYLELVDPPAEGEADQAATSTVVDLAASAELQPLNAVACEPCGNSREGVVVAAGGPVLPPAAWFEDPQLSEPTPVTILDDGRIFGHLGLWNSCHIGVSGRCVEVPHSASNYSDFRVAACHTAEGTRVPTATLFMGTDHASVDPRLSVGAVQAHYANTGQATADVASGEDEHGVWIAGAMRPDLTPEQIRAARGSVLSGDWRPRRGSSELVAALHVNVPGFPVPHAQLVTSGGQPVALVAAGAMANYALAKRRRKVTENGMAAAIAKAVRRELEPLTRPVHDAARQAARERVAAAQPPKATPAQLQAARDALRARVGV